MTAMHAFDKIIEVWRAMAVQQNDVHSAHSSTDALPGV